MSSSLQQPCLVPAPASVHISDGNFVLNCSARVISSAHALKTAETCAEQLRKSLGLKLECDVAEPKDGCIHLELDESVAVRGVDFEAYTLTVTPRAVVVKSCGEAGLFYGFQTFRQLLPAEAFTLSAEENSESGRSWSIQCISIEDKPRFAWRGAHLDVGRHFMPKEFVKKYIDLLSQHKMNRFHWHLTEDQGWRIEIKRYPKLTEIGAWRSETLLGHAGAPQDQFPWKYDGTPHGGFYTQDDVREVVAYAAERHVTVVPEIEMPGHSHAAIAAYPDLGNVENEHLSVCTYWGVNENVLNVHDSTLTFMKNVLEEVLELFPSTFIHIGGDECSKEQWKRSPDAQKRIKDLGLKDEDELQSWFIKQIDEFLTSKGRRLVGWDEILEGGLAKDATVMSWRGIAGGVAAAKMGHDVIMTPMSETYLDFYQSAEILEEPLAIGGCLPLEKVYSFDPVPQDFSPEEAAHVLGTQCQLWTEYMSTPSHVEYMAFPRLCAIAEVAWTFVGRKSLPRFERNLNDGHLDRLSAQHVNFWQRKQKSAFRAEDEKYYVVQHLDFGIVAGKAFANEAEACCYFDSCLCMHFAAMLMDDSGTELRYYGNRDERVLHDFHNWLQKRRYGGELQ